VPLRRAGPAPRRWGRAARCAASRRLRDTPRTHTRLAAPAARQEKSDKGEKGEKKKKHKARSPPLRLWPLPAKTKTRL